MKKSRLLRFAVPAAIGAGTMAFASFGNLTNAGAQVPNLPPLTANQLLSKVATANVPAFNGSVQLVANLGLPDLGSFGSSTPNSFTDLLTGTHTATIAADGQDHVSVTTTAANAESRWVRNGADVWAWNSQTQKLTHATIPADAKDANDEKDAAKQPDANSMDPTALADQLLAQIGPSTNVSVRTSAYVAGRAAYQLVLSPKSSASTVGEVVLAVDGATGTPLDISIIAKGKTKPSLELGFTSITFAAQAASTFVMTPAPGVTVVEAASVSDLLPVSQSHHRDHGDNKDQAPNTNDPTQNDAAEKGSGTVGADWDSVMIRSTAGLNGQIMKSLSSGKQITLADGTTATVVTTPLVNVALAADGRMAIGAVNVDALKAALNAPTPAA
jgi:outer membrane lipoprotein-sorting protein